jgi:hypothetical protein
MNTHGSKLALSTEFGGGVFHWAAFMKPANENGHKKKANHRPYCLPFDWISVGAKTAFAYEVV